MEQVLVTSDNIEILWPVIIRTLRKANYVALDTEFTGLGIDKGLNDQFVSFLLPF